MIFYLMSGRPHVPYLLTSIYSLRTRANYDGVIRVYAWEESYDLIREISNRTRGFLNFNVLPRTPEYRGKNSQFFDKVKLSNELADAGSDYEAFLYLDADAMPVKSLDYMLSMAKTHKGFVATQFADWVSNIGNPRKRLAPLQNYRVDQTYVRRAMTQPYPSPNGGVFAFSPEAKAPLKKWLSDTNLVKEEVFIADEVVLHTVVAAFNGRGLNVMHSGVYNASPKYFNWNGDQEPYVIHFHGDSNCKKKGDGQWKSERGVDLWLPVLRACWERNLGDIRDWLDSVGNKHINQNILELL